MLAAVVPSPTGKSPRVNPRDGLRYRWIPSGSYFTGCLPEDRQCFGLERHPAKIAVSGFWMGHTEVTQSAWRRVTNTCSRADRFTTSRAIYGSRIA